MNIDEIYEKILEQPRGSQYFKSDLHLHFEPESNDENVLNNYCQELFNILKTYKIKLIALTVHRQQDLEILFKGIEKLTEISSNNNNKIYIFPSIEIKDSNNAHVSIIFNYDKSKEDVISFLGSVDIRTNTNDNNRDHCDIIGKNIISDKSKIIKKLSDYSAIAFFPHPLSDGGVTKTISGEALKNYIYDSVTYLWNLGIPETINLDKKLKSENCPRRFTSTPSRYETEKNFKRIARIKVSDAHSTEELNKIYSICPNCQLFKYCNVGYTYLKISSPTINALKQIEYDSKTRIQYNIQGIYDYPKIIGLYVKGIFYQEKFFSFNPKLNVLIGGRGTGKSLIIDFIRFACDSIPLKDLEYYPVFEDKIRELLGHEGKVILFYKINNDQIFAIERVLLLMEKSDNINWETDVKTIFHQKNKEHPFIDLPLKQEDKIFIEALSQTEIPKIYKKTNSLLEIFDAFFEVFPEKNERERKIKELDSL